MDKLCVIDFETDNTEGCGLLLYHEKFKILSMSAHFPSKEGKCVFLQDTSKMIRLIGALLREDYRIVVYNASFEIGCFERLGFDIADNVIDAMWLFKSIALKGKSASLVAAVEEILKVPNFKEVHIQKLIDSGRCSSLKEAKAMVGSLKDDDLEAYNNDDVIYTYKIYEELVKRAEKMGYSWELPHGLYMGTVRRNVKAYLMGVKYDRVKGEANLVKMCETRDEVIDAFFKEYAEAVETALSIIYINKHANKKKEPPPFEWGELTIDDMKEQFNLNSSTQLAIFLTEALNIYPPKLTKGGKPATDKKTLPLYGDAGKAIANISNFKKPIQEITALLEHSKDDGRIHCLIRAGGTITNRGASGLTN